ncbi:MAG TPA: hypothetical protein VLQ48_11020 [Chloroflexia bacterium]|nr:hypothetical protein [Chloroflexia bacterium]
MGTGLSTRIICGLFAALVATVLVGCGSASTPTPPATSTAHSAAEIQIVEVPETADYRDPLAKDMGDITWTAVTQTTGVSQDAQARAAAIEAIKTEGHRLAAVDYSALSLDAFKDVTGKRQLTDNSFAGGDVRLEYVGEQNGNLALLLYDYKGEMLPQLPDRPQVYRWVHVYALYSIPTGAVVRLAATIRGEVQE